MYVDKDYMIARFGEDVLIELTDRATPQTGEIVDAILDSAITTASGLIDGYVAGRYRVPITPVPEIIKDCTAKITFFYLCGERYTDANRKAYEDSVSILRDIGAGKAHLDAAGVEPASSRAEARVEAPDRVFSRDSLKGY